jgi:hypothetical protein
MADTIINAGDELPFLVTFQDNGTPTAPASATYQVLDLETGAVIRAETAISPIAAQVTITLTWDDNQMQNDGQDSETHLLIVVASFGTDTAGKPRQKTASTKYQVQRSP